jgi:23S rRNA (uracil1939-C5)-methyltransferase
MTSAQPVEVTIESLGTAGDGIARHGGERLFVPLTLPGEHWRVLPGRRVGEGRQALPIERLAGGARADPPCPWFGRCGGCRLQHLPAAAYTGFKAERIRTALARQGLGQVPIEPVRTAPLASRRRIRLALSMDGRQLRLGFRARASHAVVPIDQCLISVPELQSLLQPLAVALGRALSRPPPPELSLTAGTNGIDLHLHARRAPTLDERQDLAALATDLDLARLTWSDEPIAERRRPMVRLAGIEVPLPAGGFLQATAFADTELALALQEWAGPASNVADLHAGLGTLSLPLATAGIRVHAVDTATDALLSLRAAAAGHRLPVTTEARDLARRPLGPAELARFDLVVLDPPRAGAAEQARALAASQVPRLIHAACDPATFTRDARILTEGGYQLLTVRPLDQFLFSAEIELVALFVRGA